MGMVEVMVQVGVGDVVGCFLLVVVAWLVLVLVVSVDVWARSLDRHAVGRQVAVWTSSVSSAQPLGWHVVM